MVVWYFHLHERKGCFKVELMCLRDPKLCFQWGHYVWLDRYRADVFARSDNCRERGNLESDVFAALKVDVSNVQNKNIVSTMKKSMQDTMNKRMG